MPSAPSTPTGGNTAISVIVLLIPAVPLLWSQTPVCYFSNAIQIPG